MSAGNAQLVRGGRAGSIVENGVRYEADYQVLTTDKNDGPAIVSLANGIPRYGDVYAVGTELDFGVNCISIEPRQDTTSPYKWIVHVVWSAELGSDPQNINPNPTIRPAIIRWLHEEYQEETEKDINGTLIATANGERFMPPTQVTRFRPVVHIERNYLVFNDSLQFNYLDAVNSDSWLGGTARTWRCRQLQVDPMFERNIRYKRVTAEMVYKYDEWTLTRLHEGYKYRQSSATTSLIESPGRKTPVFLDSTGVKATTPSYLTFYIHREVSFNALGLI